MAELITKLCTTKLAILKWLQILCCMVTVLFLIDGRYQWVPYTAIFITDVFLGVLCFITMVIYFLQVHRQNKSKWTLFETVFNLSSTILSLTYSILLIYDVMKMSSGEFHHHRYLPAQNIGSEGWKNRIFIVIISQTLNTVFFAVSFYRVKAVGIDM